MNLNPNRPTDEQIKQALLNGGTIKQVCKELKTHSQRVMQVKERYGLEVKVIGMGDKKGCKSFWSISDNPVRNQTRNYSAKKDEFAGAF